MRLSERLSEIFLKEGLISDEEKEIIQFGLESVEGNLTGVILTILVGIIFGAIREAMLFYIWFLPLRKSIGGFHADTKAKCLLASALAMTLALILFSLFRYPGIVYLICGGIFSFVIFLVAPVDNPQKKFDASEQSVYRKRSRVVLLGESTLFVISYYNSWKAITISLCMTFFVASISLLLGILKNTRNSQCDLKI